MLFKRVERTIDRYRLLEKGDRLIVGVSAGVDSMVLLHLLSAFRKRFDLSLIVAHVNHGLRPGESEKEAKLVQREAVRLGIPFEYASFNVKKFQKQGGYSLQDAARRLRFRFFQELLQKYHAQKIALGHHADDQAETFLLRLLRGAGSQGLKGMLPIREGKIIRPLLETWRRDIESYASDKKIPFLHDSSNLKQDYLRNKIRMDLIPYIERKYQPNLKEILLRTADILKEENDFLEEGAEKAYRKIVRQGKNSLSFSYPEYRALPPAIQWRVLRQVLESASAGGSIEEEIAQRDIHKLHERLSRPSPSFLLDLSGGIHAEKRYDSVSFTRGGFKTAPPFELKITSPGRKLIKEIGRTVVLKETGLKEYKNQNGTSETAFLDFEKITFPVKIRNFRPGDRFQPLGMRGTQKLKDFFINHKIPRQERSKIPLLISGERIAWIMGYRIDERVKVTGKTKKILKVTFV